MTWLEYAVLAVVAIIILLPPKYDPAIRMKERNERLRKEQNRD
jgi:hypothetical protein